MERVHPSNLTGGTHAAPGGARRLRRWRRSCRHPRSPEDAKATVTGAGGECRALSPMRTASATVEGDHIHGWHQGPSHGGLAHAVRAEVGRADERRDPSRGVGRPRTMAPSHPEATALSAARQSMRKTFCMSRPGSRVCRGTAQVTCQAAVASGSSTGPPGPAEPPASSPRHSAGWSDAPPALPPPARAPRTMPSRIRRRRPCARPCLGTSGWLPSQPRPAMRPVSGHVRDRSAPRMRRHPSATKRGSVAPQAARTIAAMGASPGAH